MNMPATSNALNSRRISPPGTEVDQPLLPALEQAWSRIQPCRQPSTSRRTSRRVPETGYLFPEVQLVMPTVVLG